MAERLFHCVIAREWRALAENAPWEPPSLAAEGFVHLSFAAQLAGTLSLHFATEDELYLLELDPARLASELELEVSRGAVLFPHLYRALITEDVLAWWHLPALAEERAPASLDWGSTPGAPPRG